MRRRRWRELLAAVAPVAIATVVASCGSGATASSPTTTAAQPPRPLRILVTNDDGVGAAGIDVVVQVLRGVPATAVTVVAPATNQTLTDGRTTPGALTAVRAATASGYPAWAVQGYPADTVAWAVDDHGISFRPDLVVSGINAGQNVGPLVTVSGTVGAAVAAVNRGIPALAASQGIDNGAQPDYNSGATQVVAWVGSHRAELLRRSYGSALPQANLNVPTCPGGHVRGPVAAPLATTLTGVDITTVDCASTATSFADDAAAFVLGFAVTAPLQPGR